MAISKQLSIRMPIELARQLEAKGKVSPFVIEAVLEKLERERQDEIRRQLLCLAEDDDSNDISDLSPAQRKVMARGD